MAALVLCGMIVRNVMTDETMMSFTEESAGLFLASDDCER